MKHVYRNALTAALFPLLLGACATMTGGANASSASHQTPAQAKAAAFKKAYPNGLPPVGSPFSKLRLGMGVQRVRFLIGNPTSRVTHKPTFTTKEWILGTVTLGLDQGADKGTILKVWRYRHEGELVFMTHNMDTRNRGRLIRIIVNPNASGFRS